MSFSFKQMQRMAKSSIEFRFLFRIYCERKMRKESFEEQTVSEGSSKREEDLSRCMSSKTLTNIGGGGQS